MRCYKITVRFFVCLWIGLTWTTAPAFSSERPTILLIDFPPLVMDEGDQDIGMMVDFGKAVIEELKTTHQIDVDEKLQILPLARAIQKATSEPNVIMLQMTPAPSRKDKFIWIKPTIELSFAFITTKKPAINSLDEALKLNSIAVYRVTRLESLLRERGFNNSLNLTNDSLSGARLLNAGRVESWYASTAEAKWLHKTNVLRTMPVIGKTITKIPIWAVMSKGSNPKNISALEATINQLQASGFIGELAEKYQLN